jgi:hypothetical protein
MNEFEGLVDSEDEQLSSYLSTDEFTVVYQDLKALEIAVGNANIAPHWWKWAIIIAHNTLQGACTCFLTNTAGVGALKNDSTKEILNYLDPDTETGETWPKEELAPLSQLLFRLPDEIRIDLNGITTPYPFDRSGDIKRLQDFRDEFVHFTPKGWLIEIEGLPRIIGNTLDLIQEVINRSDYKRRNRFLELPMSNAIENVRKTIRSL